MTHAVQWLTLSLTLACAATSVSTSCEAERGDDTCALSLSMKRHGDAKRFAPPVSESIATCNGQDHRGQECVFPFVLHGVKYSTCTSYGHPGKQWCATEVDHEGSVTMGMYCSEECPQDRRTALEACKAVSMGPQRCGAKDPWSDVEACLVNACPARCKNQSTFPYPGSEYSYSAVTGFPAIHDAILEKQLQAVKTLKHFAPGFSPEAEAADFLHSTLSYICCKDEKEVIAYQKALSEFKFSWKDVGAIDWTEVGCSLDSIANPSIVYLEAFTSEKTNEKLMRFAHKLEAHMAGLGFVDSNPRAIPFHFVISMLPMRLPDGPALNVGDAMKAISTYDFGTTYLCEFYFLGLPCLGLPVPGCSDTQAENGLNFGMNMVYASDWEDCPYGKDALGETRYMTFNGLRVMFKVVHKR
ncbi:unnamed protein product [Symbiodinium natans]|uniref:Fibronectin type-II domain-containing protein n=1 Tax=Symbiodinium natans TaxID=878477 RepID=A0A812I6C3_9DINO|nr:unnamed protein product [Symbiodinium natans]